jgi:exo-1,4-beta-D-glucosaminidase
VVNSVDLDFNNLKAKAGVWDLKLNKRFSQETLLDVPPDSSRKVLDIPDMQDLTTTYFVYLTLQDSGGKTVSTNLYWLSAKPDVLDEASTTWYYTPARSQADLTGLSQLLAVKLKAASKTEPKGDENSTCIKIANPGPNLAFFIRLKIKKGQGAEEVLPILWSDNYFSLMPGEERDVTAIYPRKELRGDTVVVQATGWNVAEQSF